ncbi:MAG: hypothetical protein IAE77_11210 [Prosthecobacter sp.]|uniref:hypothetical protein n=1 Tax=Prosthecobacter sp. TaxID=1965333 RepID=UPI0019F492B4|nr:hypothetical protein [Prosthecobacter sp.]MBE2284015.1 hypothetical protein [Prosthecobacter sp.]
MGDEGSCFEDGRFNLEDGRFNLEDGRFNLEDGRFNLEDGRLNLEDGRLNLEDGRLNLEDGRFNPEDRRLNLEDGRFNLEDGRLNLEDRRLNPEDGRFNLEDAFFHRLRGCEALEPLIDPLEGRIMALWSSGVTWSSGALWSPTVSPPGTSTHHHRTQRKPMKRNNYYPRREPERPEWHANFAAKLLIHGPTLGLSAAVIANAVADNLMLAYALGDWKTNLYEMGPAGTAALRSLESGTGTAAFVFPTYTAPALPTLPATADPVTPGALERTFLLVQEIKGKLAYDLPMGLDMGIVGSEMPPPPPGEPPPPRVTATVVDGTANQAVSFKFFKDGHQGVLGESQRGTGGMELLTMSTKSPIVDDRPLLVPGQAEVRQYRFRFYDNGQVNGAWTDILRITVGP